ncbi:MAG: hypothetical protein LBP81_09155 [Treponema sp.]|jgi:hypothetical protein|nr:hypothetical protein [Treponema sp.]
MNGGSVSGNTAESYGGGVCFWGSFTMNGGSVSGNTASSYGGGVYMVYGSLSLIKTGGIIHGSNAEMSLRNTAGGNGDVLTWSGKKRNSTLGGQGMPLPSPGTMTEVIRAGNKAPCQSSA